LVTSFTPSATKVFNLIPADLGRPISDITSRLHYDGFLRDLEQVLEDLRTIEREVRVGDGEEQWYLTRIAPYRSNEDRIAGVVATFVEFTARRRAEDELRRSEERYRLLVEGVAEYAMIMSDAEGRITTWNSGARKIFGRSEAESLGQPLALLFTEEDRAAGIPERELASAASHGPASEDRWKLRKDGTRFWASGVTTALRDANGELLGFATILRDNTGRMNQASESERPRAPQRDPSGEPERPR
jgi:two-component system CheB/CheR fusion protein